MPLTTGWNFVSMPTTSNQTVGDVFGDLLVYAFPRRSWLRQGPEDALEPQRAYWVYSPAPTTSAAVTGLLAADPIPLRRGLNMVGPGAVSANLYNPENLTLRRWQDNDWRPLPAISPLDLFQGYLIAPPPRACSTCSAETTRRGKGWY